MKKFLKLAAAILVVAVTVSAAPDTGKAPATADGVSAIVVTAVLSAGFVVLVRKKH